MDEWARKCTYLCTVWTNNIKDCISSPNQFIVRLAWLWGHTWITQPIVHSNFLGMNEISTRCIKEGGRRRWRNGFWEISAAADIRRREWAGPLSCSRSLYGNFPVLSLPSLILPVLLIQGDCTFATKFPHSFHWKLRVTYGLHVVHNQAHTR